MIKSNIKKKETPTPTSTASAVFTIIGIIVISLMIWGIYQGEKNIKKNIHSETLPKPTLEEIGMEVMREYLEGRNLLSEEEEKKIITQMFTEEFKKKKGEKFDSRIKELYLQQKSEPDSIKKSILVEDLRKIINQ